jgi:hypothetical protein
MKMAINSGGQLNPEILSLPNVAMNLFIQQSKNSNNTDSKEKAQEQIKEMKNMIGNFVETMITNNPSDQAQTISNDIFSVQLSSTSKDNQKAIIDDAVSKGLSVLNFTECEDILKKNYNISKETDLIMRKIDYNPATDMKKLNDSMASNSITFAFYHPEKKFKLNISYCDNIPVSLKIPLKNREKLNLTQYEKFKDLNIDPFDKNSPGLNDRCITLNEGGKDITVNKRRQTLFQNQSASCDTGCEYKGLDENQYMICDCKPSESEMGSTFKEDKIEPILTLNFVIIKCWKVIFTEKTLDNPAFYICIGFLFTGILSYLLFKDHSYKLIENNVSDVIRNDARIFNKNVISEKKYFNQKVDENILQKIESNICDKNQNNNSNYKII